MSESNKFDAETLAGLLAKVKVATTSSDLLDQEIFAALGPGYDAWAKMPHDDAFFFWRSSLPYSSSIDASLALAERILGSATMWSVCIMEDGPYAQILRPMPDGGYAGGHAGAYGNSAPLAILAALISALSQGEQT